MFGLRKPKLKITIFGMANDDTPGILEEAISKIPGVRDVQINIRKNLAVIRLEQEDNRLLRSIIQIIYDYGFAAEEF